MFCSPFFVAGGLIYLYRMEIETVVKKHKKAFLAICVIATVCFYLFPGAVRGEFRIGKIEVFTTESICLFTLWISYAIGGESRLMNNKIIHYLGGISMEMYLAQMIVFRVIEKIGIIYILGYDWASFGVTCVIEFVVLIVGIACYHKIEKVVLQLYGKYQKGCIEGEKK